MRKLNLVLHCGADAVDRDQLREVATPPATDTHFPIPHNQLVRRVYETVKSNGGNIVTEAHALSHGGDRYFGMIQVGQGENFGLGGEQERDYGLVIGIRNSHDKAFAAGLALGNGVFVCDNLAFNAEITVSRKHTRFIHRDLSRLVCEAVGKLGDVRRIQDQRITCYKGHEILDKEAHDIVINSLDAGVIPASKIPMVLTEWRNPRHEEFKPRTAWSLFNDVTEVLKGYTPNDILRRTQRLNGILDTHCGLVTAS